jgi:SAM-dependent methyltransferase
MTSEHDAAEYGRHVAAEYDAIYGGVHDTEGAVDRLRELAAGGAVLEFGVGTGRLAIPLALGGLRVHGIDGSDAMISELHARPGGDLVTATVGDFSSTVVDGLFDVVVLAVNTIYAVPDQDTQVACFVNAARHLAPGGRFVVEAWVPSPEALSRPVAPRRLAGGHVGLVLAEHDPVDQRLETTQVVLGGRVGLRVFPVVHRYAHPAELDLMARLAGFHRELRWADWRRTPFSRHSSDHVTVYRLAP